MHWGIGIILIGLGFVFPALSCEDGELFAFRGRSLKAEDSLLLKLPPQGERHGLWLAAEYEGQRAIAISRYISSAHYDLDKRLKQFFGGYYTFKKSWWPEMTYLGGGEFYAKNSKDHTAVAEVRAVHDSCGFLKGPRSKYKDMENDPSVFLELTPKWLSGKAEKKRLRDGVPHLNPLLALDVSARHDLLKPSYILDVIGQLHLWGDDRKSAAEVRELIMDENIKGHNIIDLGIAHATLLRQDDFEFAPATGLAEANKVTEAQYIQWETYLKDFNKRAYELDELTAMCRLAGKIYDAASAYGDRVARDIEVFIP
ncbi:MAG: hypothetical protein R3B54_18280 [Bdellovibrionota bacterium]